MWDIWLWPMVIAFGVMVWICIAGIRKTSKSFQLNVTNRIPETAADHPFTMNPLLWIIFVASLFIFIVIFYYWASFY
ncbi:hypothetical protein DV702_01800 [Sporosarcina sp. PTS2304]|uniref:hypothetical protein n=1 Tax=Sporosarcina sp. PTS2304 TaxID=2283194 RepID=UPI000E0D16D6|nr:hypothetical protein [Sporosarcina sp. PTS2304]AXH98553.1 hypothetical protein DV702_01800 [Sporosarcina sp. PTS2304]